MVREAGELTAVVPAPPACRAEPAAPAGLITRPEDLPAGFRLTPAEREFFAGRTAPNHAPPFAVTRHLLGLIDPEDPNDPIRRQFLPTGEELQVHPGELEDPLGEERAQAAPGLLHRYPDRALLLVTDRCPAYCRHCFRRRLWSRVGQAGSQAPAATAVRWAQAAAYLARHPEVRELILSGGEPLLLSDERLRGLLAAFRVARPDLAFRIHTRIPVTLPSRVTEKLAELLGSCQPLRAAVQVNHPRELAPAMRDAVRRLQSYGIPVLSQSVLLRGVNDRPETLAALFHGLAAAGIQPYYLFQPDLARGTAHFRPPLASGLRLFAAVRRLCEAGELPRYVQDLPGGGGKIPLEPVSGS